MLLPIIALAVAALIASGSLFKHTHILTYIAVSLGLWQVGWLLLTLIDRTLLVTSGSNSVYGAGSFLLLAGALVLARVERPVIPWGPTKHDVLGDASILGLTLLVLVGAAIVIRANGFVENSWVTHGFYNGDTATFISLVRKSFDTPGLVTQNPFAGNGTLEYPTLLHAGVASLFSDAPGSWLYFIPSLSYATILLTIPLFFLLWKLVRGDEKKNWLLPVGVIALVLTASWDSFIYPQSHFFLTGVFLLQVSLLVQSYRGQSQRTYVYDVIALITTILLVLSNAVTGTAALLVYGIYAIQRLRASARAPIQMFYGGTIILLGAIFLLFTPGNGSFGGIGFSYTAASDMLRLTPLLALLFAGCYLERARQREIIPAVAGVSLLAFIVYIFSTRDIVVANASRFFYHALLIGFPLMALPLEKLYSQIQTVLFDYTLTRVMRLSFAMLTLTSLGLLLLPSGSSMASAYDNLLFKNERTVDTAMRTALWWIDDNAPADAVILASPEEPFSVPMFTGRALLRTNYWLSPGDIVEEDVRKSFEGDIAAREQVFGLADYVLLTEDERADFEPLPSQYVSVFDNNAVVIYQQLRD